MIRLTTNDIRPPITIGDDGKMVMGEDGNPVMAMQAYPILNYGPLIQTVVDILLLREIRGSLQK